VRWGVDQIPKHNCALRLAFRNINSYQGRALFLLAGRERADTGIKKQSTCGGRSQHLIPMRESVSLGSRNTTGRWRKLSKALPISAHPKGVTTEPFGSRTNTPDHG
jgi:hypothetical protein